MARIKLPIGFSYEAKPRRSGVYAIFDASFPKELREIDVYYYRPRGLCVWGPDYGAQEMDGGKHTNHISVNVAGLA